MKNNIKLRIQIKYRMCQKHKVGHLIFLFIKTWHNLKTLEVICELIVNRSYSGLFLSFWQSFSFSSGHRHLDFLLQNYLSSTVCSFGATVNQGSILTSLRDKCHSLQAIWTSEL